MKLQEIVADNLKGYRKRAGLTQEDVAARLDNMHSNHYARIERGEEGVSLEKLERLATLYSIQPHLLLMPKSYQVS